MCQKWGKKGLAWHWDWLQFVHSAPCCVSWCTLCSLLASVAQPWNGTYLISVVPSLEGDPAFSQLGGFSQKVGEVRTYEYTTSKQSIRYLRKRRWVASKWEKRAEDKTVFNFWGKLLFLLLHIWFCFLPSRIHKQNHYHCVFSPQDIDGQALLLLTLPTVQECMELKLGPAIKLCHQIERVKVAFYAQYANWLHFSISFCSPSCSLSFLALWLVQVFHPLPLFFSKNTWNWKHWELIYGGKNNTTKN